MGQETLQDFSSNFLQTVTSVFDGSISEFEICTELIYPTLSLEDLTNTVFFKEQMTKTQRKTIMTKSENEIELTLLALTFSIVFEKQ